MNSGEKQKNSIEPDEKSGWSELEELAGSDFAGNNKNEDAKTETQEERQEKISQAAAKVKESYKKSDIEELASIETEIAEEEPLSQEQSLPVGKKSQSKYDTIERSRVDRIKSDLDYFNIGEYESKQITSRPSAFTKRVRLIADRLGIRTKKSEERREREAMHIALSEYYEEKAIEKAELEAYLSRKREENEAEDLERRMMAARDEFEHDKRNRFKKQRIQEMVERDLNSRLLKVEDLEIDVLSENPEIQKRLVSFEDVDIPVYDLKGLPFSFLSTTIDYRSANNPGEIGTDTFRKVLEDPSIWAQRRDEAEKESGFGMKGSDARGDTISASYWNSERNISSHVSGNLIYGFENVQADSIISVFNSDGGTDNMAGSAETTLSNPDVIRSLEGADETRCYNEVLLRRYSENGIPKRPDYIIVENGGITKESLRHAKYFGIPIVNIERSVYMEKQERRGEELLNSISEDDSYEEMNRKIEELLSMSRYKSLYYAREAIGRNFDILDCYAQDSLGKRCFELSRMEQLKRLDFIKDTLQKATYDIKLATEKGLPMEQNLPGFRFFTVNIDDVQNQMTRHEGYDSKGTPWAAPGNCNSINIAFRLEGSSRFVHTRIYDGERIYKVEEALANGSIKNEDIENADSSFYDALEPVVLRYFEAIRENRKSRKNVA